jgi:protein O-GlcNAc transferase
VVAVTMPADTAESLLHDAVEHLKARRLTDAELVCRRILQIAPRNADALHLLGRVTHEAGNPSVAGALIGKAIAARPTVAAYHNSLGMAYLAQGKQDAAIASLRRALEMDAGCVKADLNLGVALLNRGDLDAAVDQFQQILTHRPEDTAAHINLGVAFLLQGKDDVAEFSFRRALEIAPGDAALAHANLGGALLAQGMVEAAVSSYRRALDIDPSLATARSNLLFALHFLPDCDRLTQFSEAKLWGELHAAPLLPSDRPHANLVDPDRRLRVGYVSGDFHRHPVGYFLEAVLRAHDPAAVELFCYSNGNGVDDLTLRLRACVQHWRSVVHVNDAALTELIRRDGIDLLIDLSGHTAGNRLLAFARKPAPVLASWLGYFNTTGIAAMDYVIASGAVCPEGDDRWYVEQVVRLPDDFLCYTPNDAVPVADPPILRDGIPTFGYFGKVSKISPPVVALWARILQTVPKARLYLKDSALDKEGVRERYAQIFAGHGLLDRVELHGRSPYGEYLAAYGRVDVVLDPFPFNGGTTTVEALWMGVPVVSLQGEGFVSRMGLSHLSTAGLPEFVAADADAYVAKAVALVTDPAQLVQLRAGLRERVAQSPLCDGRRFTRALEACYRAMWRTWCDGQARGQRPEPIL